MKKKVQTYLTAKEIKSIKADPERRREVAAGVVPGLYLVIQPNGSKSWAFRYRHRGRSRKMTLGRYPALSLAAARENAADAISQVARGSDPAEIRQEQKALPDTFEAVATEFLERHCRPNTRTAPEVERVLRKEVFPYWKKRPLVEISRPQILQLLDKMMDSGRPVLTNRTLNILKRLFNWSVQRGIIEVSPATGIRPPAKEKSRDRVLEPGELVEIWKATGNLGFPFGPFFRLLILTAQRRGEVANIRRENIDLEAALWTLPPEATKPGRVHDVPLSRAAVELLENLPRFEGPHLFSTTGGERPVSGFSKAKLKLDEKIKMEAPWRIHDVRRSAATWMAGAGVAPHVLSALLNHSPGTAQGVTAIYNRFRYVEERRAALEAWSQYVLSLVDEQKGQFMAIK